MQVSSSAAKAILHAVGINSTMQYALILPMKHTPRYRFDSKAIARNSKHVIGKATEDSGTAIIHQDITKLNLTVFHNRATDTDTDRQTDRQTDTHTHTLTTCCTLNLNHMAFLFFKSTNVPIMLPSPGSSFQDSLVWPSPHRTQLRRVPTTNLFKRLVNEDCPLSTILQGSRCLVGIVLDVTSYNNNAWHWTL
jgi:hypothetical protein